VLKGIYPNVGAVTETTRNHTAIHVVLCFLLGEQSRRDLLGNPRVIAGDLLGLAAAHEVCTAVTDVGHNQPVISNYRADNGRPHARLGQL
jgi:hypothetical protein